MKDKPYSSNSINDLLNEIDNIAITKQYEFINASFSENIVDENKINLKQLSEMALEDPSTATNPKKMTIDDMKILYEHSISGELF